MAADSRSTLGSPGFLHVDSTVKIYKVNGFLIACSGVVTFNGAYLDEIIANYNVAHKFKTDCIKNFQSFVSYMRINYPYPIYDSKTNKYFSGGYVNDTAFVMYYEGGKGAAEADYCFTQRSDTDSLFKKVYNKKQSCAKIAIVAERFIQNVADTMKSKEVGGPVSIFRINKDNSIVCIKNDFSNRRIRDINLNSFRR